MAGFKDRELARRAGMKSSRAGVTDRFTMATREAFKNLVDNNLPRLQADLDALEPKDRLDMIIKLAAFVLPKLQAVDVTTGGEQIERRVIVKIEENGNNTQEY